MENDEGVVNELIANGLNVLISGLSLNNSYSAAAHQLEEANKINLIGGTHYSSEKYACIARGMLSRTKTPHSSRCKV